MIACVLHHDRASLRSFVAQTNLSNIVLPILLRLPSQHSIHLHFVPRQPPFLFFLFSFEHFYHLCSGNTQLLAIAVLLCAPVYIAFLLLGLLLLLLEQVNHLLFVLYLLLLQLLLHLSPLLLHKCLLESWGLWVEHISKDVNLVVERLKFVPEVAVLTLYFG